MRYSNSFGKKSSKILLGTAYFGGDITKRESFELMDKYYELGGRHIDTARMYTDGASECVVGEWLKSRNYDDVFVSSKGGFPTAEQPDVSRLSESDIRSDLEASLRALKCDCIEFYWLHRDDEKIPVATIIDMMNALVKEGKIKKFGASNWRACRIDEANEYAKKNGLLGFFASQVRFSPAIVAPSGNADRNLVDIDRESFSYYSKNNMPVMAYASQAKGFFSKMAIYGESGLSKKSKERYLCDENLKKLEIIKQLSKKYECSVAAIVCGALCSLSDTEVFPIIGGSKIDQICDSMVGGDIVINKDELKSVFDFLL